MPRFSLIVATIGRVQEVSLLLDSISKQQGLTFELILVDQNSDNRLHTVVSKWAIQMAKQHWWFNASEHLIQVRSAPGLSRARNVGIARSQGEILAFPDDDCWYPLGLLHWIDSWFSTHEAHGFVSVGSRNEAGIITGNRLGISACEINRFNIFRASVSYSIFLRRPASQAVMFDESLGLGSGTSFGSGEDTDLLLEVLRKGVRGRFEPGQHVFHPAKGHLNPARGFSYGMGWGRVLRKHGLPLQAAAFISFDLLRAMVHQCRGDATMAKTMTEHARGILTAYRVSESLLPG